MRLGGTHFELDERVENGRTIFTHTQHMKPIASYKNGSLRRDPFTLSATGSADWPVAVDGICDVRIAPRIAGKSPVLHVGHGKDFARFALVGANNVKGVVKDNSTLFVNAWNNADLRYEYGGHLLRESISLRANHPRSFGFILHEHSGFDPVAMTVGSLRIMQPTLEPPDGSALDMLTVPLKWLVAQQGGKWTLTVTLPEGDWTGWTLDPTLTLQPNPTDGKDTKLYQAEPTFNYGASAGGETGMAFGTRLRLLYCFSLATLPVGVTVTNGALSLYCNQEFSATDYDVGIHTALTEWWEGSRTGSAPPAGEDGACWNLRNANGAVAWAGGAGGAAGSDWTAIATATTTITGINAWFTWDATADIVAWVGGASNYGWWALNASESTNSSAKRFVLSDYTTDTSLRPKLVIEYTLPGGGGIFQSSIFQSAVFGGIAR